MARFEFKLPDIGEGVTEGEIVAWHVQNGDHVTEDQLMVEVMTDKATVTIGAPRSGRVAGRHAEVGTIVQVGQVLLVLETGNGSPAAGHSPKKPASAVGDIGDSLPGASYFASHPPREHRKPAAPDPTVDTLEPLRQARKNTGGEAAGKPLATPAIRRLARQLGVDLRLVPATGPDGRVTREDVLGFAKGQPTPASASRTPPAGTEVMPPTSRSAAPAAGERRIPFVGMRRKIAERMRESKDRAAHFTFVEECDATALLSLRQRLAEDARRMEVQLTFLPLVVKAVVAALRKHPMLNSRLDAQHNEIVIPDTYNIGIAVATDQGLVVPVVHHAGQMSIIALAKEIDRLSRSARAGQLTVTELSGSTFTITSLGKQAGLFAVPIINQPNVGILGIHRIKERPVVRDGQIVVGQVMMLSLSLDHRIVDGHQGAAFAYDVISYLEDPARLLLEA